MGCLYALYFPPTAALPPRGVLPGDDQREGCTVLGIQKQSAKRCLQSGKLHPESVRVACQVICFVLVCFKLFPLYRILKDPVLYDMDLIF